MLLGPLGHLLLAVHPRITALVLQPGAPSKASLVPIAVSHGAITLPMRIDSRLEKLFRWPGGLTVEFTCESAMIAGVKSFRQGVNWRICTGNSLVLAG
jgi:hypothetical protein